MSRYWSTPTRLFAILFLAATFAASTASAKTELWVFSSPSCGPCQQLKPTLAQFEQQGYPIRQIDISVHPAMASQYSVSRVPCLMMVADGKELTRQLGGDGNTIAQMFAAAGVTPTQPAASARWAGQSHAAPALPPRPLNHTQHTEPAGQLPPTDGMARQLLECSVRLTVSDATGKSYGTGTIIDTLQQDALIVTCGHLFRGEAEKGEIIIEQFGVTAEGLRVTERSRGQLIHHDLDRDVALVSFRPTGPVKKAPVASQLVENVNDRVWSVGCDRGADPTVRSSRVTALDRYHGAPNIEAAGAPVQGRSGGGLFNAKGELVGVCFAADNEGDEGLYSSLPSIHAELDKVGLQRLYRGGEAIAQTATPAYYAGEGNALTPLPPMSQPGVEFRGQDPDSTFPSQPPVASPPNSLPSQAFPPMDSMPAPPVAGSPSGQGMSPAERAALGEIARRASESEVVVIVRPRDDSGNSEVIQLGRVSPEFVEQLRTMHR
ncbi:trypsin-like peptidase domain-containing protein [Aeoliella sp. SH292]|uniref:trypsin-like peptidase domain-containing protein n=1 Tax=Aeoliella sp. SH292 TaxID=3454464 RepID=UPI003F9B2685